MKRKLIAKPIYDDEIENWVIEVNVDGVNMPIGITIDEKLEIFKIFKFTTKEEAENWLKEHKDQFIYNKDIKVIK